jgi:hypothetical protein
MHLRGMDCENGGLLELAENLVQLRNWLYWTFRLCYSSVIYIKKY